MFADAALLPILLSRARASTPAFLIALAAVAACWLFLRKTFAGFQMRVAGLAPAAARYAGFSTKRTIWIGMLIGGACAGIAGMGEVAGPIGQLVPSVSPGYGFAAIIVAFVGRLHPIGILLASLLMSLLYLGGESAQMSWRCRRRSPGLFQGMLLFFLLAADVFINYRLRVRRHGRRFRPADLVASITSHPASRRDARRRHAAGFRRAGRARHRKVGRAQPRRRRHDAGRRGRGVRHRASHGKPWLGVAAGMAAAGALMAAVRRS